MSSYSAVIRNLLNLLADEWPGSPVDAIHVIHQKELMETGKRKGRRRLFGIKKGNKYPPDDVYLGETPQGDYILRVKGPFGDIARHKDEKTYDRWLKYLIRDQSEKMKKRVKYLKGYLKEMRKKRQKNE